jgi:predicted lipoprotein with Yx(FWY)xxD motif
MKKQPHRRRWIAIGAVLLVAVAGCGDDSADEGSAAAGSPTTVSVESVDGMGDVLVDSEGAALYTADQEQDGTVRCTRSCAEIWIPVTLPEGREPSGPEELSDDLGVAERPDGTRQLTFGGRPLYRFAEDPAPGEVTGHGLSDRFHGRLFSWQVATADGESGGDRLRGVGPY